MLFHRAGPVRGGAPSPQSAIRWESLSHRQGPQQGDYLLDD